MSAGLDLTAAVEAGAVAMFWTDDVGGHIRGPWTWETIPEVGRGNYRAAVNAVLGVAAPIIEAQVREQVAREIEAECPRHAESCRCGSCTRLRKSARIARGPKL